MINLRPHHGMCIGQFMGKGYSEEFVANMYKVIEELEQNREEVIRLVCSVDVICNSCPHNKEGNCRSGQKVAEYDAMALKLCGLSVNDTVTWSEFKRLVKVHILEEQKLSMVCHNCSWLSLCQECQGFRYNSDIGKQLYGTMYRK